MKKKVGLLVIMEIELLPIHDETIMTRKAGLDFGPHWVKRGGFPKQAKEDSAAGRARLGLRSDGYAIGETAFCH